MAKKEKCRSITTPEFRVSYPHVFKPQALPGSKPKYSIKMLFPKDKDLSIINKSLTECKLSHYGPKNEWPDGLASPIEDGDDPKHADKQGYAGHWVVSASCNAEFGKPTVVGTEKDDNGKWIEIDSTSFYPGCYARANIFPTSWNFMGREGVMFILDHVQKLRDGKSFGGKKPAEQAFDPIASDEDDDLGDEFDFR